MKGQFRTYRSEHNDERFRFFRVEVFESDLHLGVDKPSFVPEMVISARDEIIRIRELLNSRIAKDRSFLTSLKPLEMDSSAESEVQSMLAAGIKAKVGPMAAVAGLTSERVGRYLIEKFNISEIVVENGGDIWASVKEPLFVEILAGNSPLSGKIALKIPPERSPLGICTSSGTVGHSLSFGKADAVVICAADCAVSDAFATAVCNMVKSEYDIEKTLEFVQSIPEIISAVIVINDKIAVSGEFEIVPVRKDQQLFP